jgi:hypothetical protein
MLLFVCVQLVALHEVHVSKSAAANAQVNALPHVQQGLIGQSAHAHSSAATSTSS